MLTKRSAQLGHTRRVDNHVRLCQRRGNRVTFGFYCLANTPKVSRRRGASERTKQRIKMEGTLGYDAGKYPKFLFATRCRQNQVV